jgi:geranylgeranyl reductase family protein
MEMKRYDVIIAGAGMAGLNAARTISSRGHKVLVLEEKAEIGQEKCSGIINLHTLKELKIPPERSIIVQHIKNGRVIVDNKEFNLSLTNLNLIVLDRKKFDRYLASLAVREGSDISLGEKVVGVEEKDGIVVKTVKRRIEANFFIDARGVREYVRRNPKGTLPAIQYLVVSRKKLYDGIMVWLNDFSSKDFFTWYVPISDHESKVGSAGKGEIGLDEIFNEFELIPIKKTLSYIIVGGPLKKLVNGRVAIVGDAAGQTKPTTGGGIYYGGIGGRLAGLWASKAIELNEPSLLKNYEIIWKKKMGKELNKQKLLRNLFLKLGRKQIGRLLEALYESHILDEALKDDLFNLQSITVKKLLSDSRFIKRLGSSLLNYIKGCLKDL